MIIDLTMAGCKCEHDVTKHFRMTFTNKVTGAPIPAIVCNDNHCFCWRSEAK